MVSRVSGPPRVKSHNQMSLSWSAMATAMRLPSRRQTRFNVRASRSGDRRFLPLAIYPHERPRHLARRNVNKCARPGERVVCRAINRHRHVVHDRDGIAQHLESFKVEPHSAQCVGRRIH